MATAKKKPSAKQLAARRKFARMAKSGELQKLAAAGRKKKARARKNQLGPRKNQLGPALIGGFGSALGGKLAEFDIEPAKKQNRHPSRLKGRKAPKGFSMPERKLTRADYNRAYKSHFGAARQKALKEISPARFGRNPKGQHVAGVAPRYQKMYEAIVSSPEAKKRYGPRLKEVAARTVKKAASTGVNPSVFYRQNPAFFGHLKRKVRRVKKAASRIKRKASRIIRRNTEPAEVFEEFRGKAPSGHIATAPMHGPGGAKIEVAELGKLRDICLKGCPDAHLPYYEEHRANPRHLKFGNGARLCSDANKRLVITGVKFKPLGRQHNCGPVNSVVYKSDKPHIEPGQQEYNHKFAEKGGTKPQFIVDTEGLPYMSGGSYKITSAGIVN